MKQRAQVQDIELLSGLLDEVVAEQAGPGLLELVDELRRLAKERRAGLPGAEERLAERVRSLNEREMRVAVRALSAFFDVANLAEDLQRVRVLRQRERDQAPRPRGESVGEAVERLRTDGLAAEQMQDVLDRLWIELVFTAHPTEAKRRTVRRLLRRVRAAMQALQSPDRLPRERERLMEQLLGGLTVLWQIDPMRPQRPTVMQEVERGLFFVEGLWEVVPHIYRDLRRTLAECWPGHDFTVPRFLRFGSWIGGDRDGNPFVTADVTARTLTVLRRAALERHLDHCRGLVRLLVMSDRRISIPDAIRQAVEQARQRWPEIRRRTDAILESEVYRRWLKVIEYRLEQALAATEAPDILEENDPAADDGRYAFASELESDIRLLADSIATHRGERIVACYLEDWLDQLQAFGLHLATLDVRQDSRVHVEVLTELLQHAGLCDDYAALDEPERQRLLAETISEPPALPLDAFDDMTRDTLLLFQVLVRTMRQWGPQALGGHVISMSHQPSDVLAVLWLWTWANRQSESADALPYLPIVPLFETIDDLDRGPQVLDELLGHPVYAEYLRTSHVHPNDESASGTGGLEIRPTGEGAVQIVMVGYSDSTKDGGYLAASWGLHRAQEQLAEVAERHGVRLVVFHGRGGALGRGGGPAARAILSLPPQSVGGALRMTEQGEVLAERYDDPQIAYRHLEQVTWATMLVSGEGAAPPQPEWVRIMGDLKERSFRHYRRLVEDAGFLAYFDQATPISEIEHLPIASRPARRRERKSLADLRAIPWTFAWTQCRHLIPAWYGLGTAVHSFVEEPGGNWAALQQMYDDWPLFRALIDNADLALAKADISIAHRYADLAGDHAAGERIWEAIAAEYTVSRAAVLMITREPDLLGGIPWLQRSIQERNPYVDPLNLIQIELIRRLREQSAAGELEETNRLRELIRLTIQGVAAGLRTTG